MKPKIYLIAAADLKGGIGLNGKLPWHLPGDLKFFQKTTIKTEDIQRRNMVIMGRVTWESIPEAHRPFKGRKNVVITKNKDFKAGEGVTVVHALDEAIKAADERVADIFIIGGMKVFEEAIKRCKIDGIYLTRIKKEFKTDRLFPKIPASFRAEKISEGEDQGVFYEFLLYKKSATGSINKPSGGGSRPNGNVSRPSGGGRSTGGGSRPMGPKPTVGARPRGHHQR